MGKQNGGESITPVLDTRSVYSINPVCIVLINEVYTAGDTHALANRQEFCFRIKYKNISGTFKH